MKSLLFIGHAFHKITKSSEFIKEILAEHYDIETFYYDPYENDFSCFETLRGKEYDALVLWQIMPSLDKLKNLIKFNHCAFFPMYDNTKTLNSPLWNEYKECNIINFSKTFHLTCKNAGLSSYYVQYFPNLAEITDEGDENSIFFWQRREKLTTRLLEKLIPLQNINKLYLHTKTDPENKFVKPSKLWKDKVIYSEWFNTKEDMQKYIQKSAMYFAPRRYEGIGMSFLEAMAAGRCVIAPDYPTMNEYIIDGFNGYLYNYKKPEKIQINNIRQIQKNTKEFIKNGREKWDKEKQNICQYIKAKPVTDKELLDKTIFIKRKNIFLFNFIPAKIEETATTITYKLFYCINITKKKTVTV